MQTRSKASSDSKGFACRPSQLNSEDMDCIYEPYAWLLTTLLEELNKSFFTVKFPKRRSAADILHISVFLGHN